MQSSTKHIPFSHILDKVGDTSGKGGIVANSMMHKIHEVFFDSDYSSLPRSLYSIKLHKGGN